MRFTHGYDYILYHSGEISMAETILMISSITLSSRQLSSDVYLFSGFSAETKFISKQNTTDISIKSP